MATKERIIQPLQHHWLDKSPFAPPEHGEDFLSENQFRRALRRERRRAERSRGLFLLVLLTGTNREDGEGRSIHGLEKIFRTLPASIRETDLWGWYRERLVGGIIFTEFNDANRSQIMATVSTKLKQAIEAVLPDEHARAIRLSFHFFPEDGSEGDQPRPDGRLYPDLADRERSDRRYRTLKRCVDVTGSLLGLILLSPVFAAIAVAIKLDSKGPVFFRQKRVGQYGAVFSFLKFRSMTVECDSGVHKEYIKRFISGEAGTEQLDAKGKKVFKIARDKRVTRVGGFLRRTSLDELPQILNVLAGKMSLVGPRPPLPYELEAYHLWHRRRIFEAKPGITGLWQVMGRSRLKFDDMVRLDLQYARNRSLWLDLKILARTPGAVFSGEGAY